MGLSFPVVLETMINMCCQNCPVLQHEMTDKPDSISDSSAIVLPVMLNFKDTELALQLVPLLPNTGVVFLIPARKKSYPMKMLKSVASTWPVLVLTLALSLLAGIIVWSLVSQSKCQLTTQLKHGQF